jgi:excisionase family DNA binding protein
LEPLAVKKKTQPRKRIKRATKSIPPTSTTPVDVLPHPAGMPSIDAYPPWRSPSQAGKYLHVSLPTVYRMFKSGALESYDVGGRRRVTTASIKYHMLPPSERGPLPKQPSAPYERLSDPPKRWPNSKAATRRRATKAGGRAGAAR